MNYEEDYLARKIVEEQINAYNKYIEQNREYNKVWKRRTYLIILTIALGFTNLCSLLLFHFLEVKAIVLFLLSLFFTIKYCKKHPKK